MVIIKIVVTLFALFALSRAILRFKKKEISKKEVLWWSLLWLTLIIVALLPGFTTFFANLFGIGRGADVVLYASVIILFYLIFKIYVKIEQVEKNLTKIVRKLTLKKK